MHHRKKYKERRRITMENLYGTKPQTRGKKRNCLKEESAEYRAKNNMADLLTSELIDMITDTKTGTAPSIGENLLKSIEGNLSQLAKMNLQDLMKTGLTEKKAMKIMAGVELGKRIAGYTEQEKPLIHGPCDAAHLLQKYLKYSLQEIFVAMSVNTKNRVIKIDVITKGILDASLVHPREVFRAAIENNASSLILAHSHPSSEITPSTQDIEITKTLVNAGKVMGIEILDHIIIGHGGKFLSMKGKRLM
jgi:DNA repair protein RadC